MVPDLLYSSKLQLATTPVQEVTILSLQILWYVCDPSLQVSLLSGPGILLSTSKSRAFLTHYVETKIQWKRLSSTRSFFRNCETHYGPLVLVFSCKWTNQCKKRLSRTVLGPLSPQSRMRNAELKVKVKRHEVPKFCKTKGLDSNSIQLDSDEITMI